MEALQQLIIQMCETVLCSNEALRRKDTTHRTALPTQAESARPYVPDVRSSIPSQITASISFEMAFAIRRVPQTRAISRHHPARSLAGVCTARVVRLGSS
ncbi:hypothetical protein KOW79_002088 [Hemibagrus wyckioides]|uniref:Uncharacterized protein n=1 Tax=Hemibagrus wyckioides TaxID=337641 RepID=A0A9D3SQM8_9TELE|nr:hypothetical protein KOW79_002088 [Hemibagrus wyckioides]